MKAASPTSKSQPEAGPSKPREESPVLEDEAAEEQEEEEHEEDFTGIGKGMDPEGFSGEKILQPLTPEALAAFKAAQDRAGVVYISRIPPGMRPAKVRHLMSGYGEVGRVYLKQEDAKRAYLRRKFTSTKKAHFVEGWVEFKDKKVARSVAEMLNAQPIGGKKGSRWRDDIWTMKYLPKFKWNMLTEQVAHEAAIHTAKLRVELSQSRAEQQEYLRNVELARVLDKRGQKKREKGEEFELKPLNDKKRVKQGGSEGEPKQKKSRVETNAGDIPLDSVLSNVF
ncbi:hypothetical protein FA15DRAFT_665134 [Coprinopsis marcescibilis]|uniref:18S rRNA factor 2 n=1 Tax=Coprinopsis marcescibilis TaxID=230819 RepID=A0A5C3L864_COPMA|nr:hypothetical protein FA15DRAFT_665134 [Coprinopsis marcescibilis]